MLHLSTYTFRIFALVASSLYLLSTASYAADTLSKIRDSKSITIAYQEGSVPFSFLDANKKPVGYAVELCLKFVDEIQRELKLPQLKVNYFPINSSNRIPAIVEGKADIECGTTTNTPERRKQVAFTIPHFMAAARMLVKADSNIKNWSDLRNKKVVITKGAVQYKLIQDKNEHSALNMTILEGKDHMDSFKTLERGEVAAFPMGDVVLYGLRAKAKDPSAFSVVGDPLSAEPYAAMFRKDDAPFKALIDTSMAKIMLSGELTKLYEKWFKSPHPALDNASLDMPMSYLLRDSLKFPSDKVAY
jgi:glutamate/aspartate transport system substrate-binding protein